MGRSLLVLGTLLLAGAAVWFLTGQDLAIPETATDAPATVGRLRGGHEGGGPSSMQLPASTVSPTRAASDPKPLESPAANDPMSAVPEPPPPGRSVSGTVIRTSDGSPLPGLTVRIQPADGKPIEVLTSDDPPGTFTLAGVPPDADELLLESRSEWPVRRAAHAVMPGEEDVVDLVLTFDSGFAVSGRVVDEQGAPIPHAQVDAQRIDGLPADATGRFFMPDIAPAAGTESVEVGARATWYQRNTEPVLVPRDSTGVPTVLIQLVGAGAVEGAVTDDGGEPVIGATVELAFLMTSQHGQTAAAGLEATSDAKGRYRIDHVPPGRYIVQAEPPHMDVFSSDSVELAASSPPSGLVGAWIVDVGVVVREATRLDIALPKSSTLSGRITDTYGTPLQGVDLLLQKSVRWPAPDLRGSSSTSSGDLRIVSKGSGDGTGETLLTTTEGKTTSDENGDYRFTDLTPGEKLLTASHADDGHVTRRETLTVGRGRAQTRDVQLATGVTVRSRVVDPAGAPIEGASVQVQPPGSQVFDNANRETTDAAGRFVLRGLQPTTMKLFIFKSGFVGLFEDIDTTAPRVEYVMEPAPSVHGRVVDALHDEPITNFTVTVEVEGSSWSNQGTFEDGKFKMDVNDDELATVSLSAPGYEPETLEGVRPSETATRPLEFRLYPAR